jgi:hypothetical protein
MLPAMALLLSRPGYHQWAANQPKGCYDDEAIAAANTVVVAEFLSPRITTLDAGDFRLAPVRHSLLVRPLRREIIHHRRTGDRIDRRVVSDGLVELDPPSVGLSLGEIYGD